MQEHGHSSGEFGMIQAHNPFWAGSVFSIYHRSFDAQPVLLFPGYLPGRRTFD
jgi:hypothetical protein